MIPSHFNTKTLAKGKQLNKETLCTRFGLDASKPLFTFIGRLVIEKGADLLPEAIDRTLAQYGDEINFFILGSGDKDMELALLELKAKYPGRCNVFIGYDEGLAHVVYAGADFLMMPSRVEPCGLNQLYSLRYGTMPLVRSTGGLIDSVIDFGDEGGYGIRFNQVSVDDICHAISRAAALYQNQPQLQILRKRMMALDFSWDRSAKEYINLYESLNPLI
jgi:starch synthase